MAKTDFELRPSETLLFEGKLNQIKSKLSIAEGD